MEINSQHAEDITSTDSLHFWRGEMERARSGPAYEKAFHQLPSAFRERPAILSPYFLIKALEKPPQSPYAKQLAELVNATELLLGPQHEETGLCRNDLCMWLLLQDLETGTDETHVKVLQECKKIQSRGQSTTRQTILRLSRLLHYLSDCAKAERFFREILNQNQQTYGADHRSTLSATCALANCLWAMGVEEESLLHYERVLTLPEEMFSTTDADLLSILHEMAKGACRGEKKLDTLEVLSRIHFREVSVLGANHRLVCETQNLIDELFSEMKWKKGSEQLWERIFILKDPTVLSVSDADLQEIWRAARHFFRTRQDARHADILRIILQIHEHFPNLDHSDVAEARDCLAQFEKKLSQEPTSKNQDAPLTST